MHKRKKRKHNHKDHLRAVFKVPYEGRICVSGAGKSRRALLQKRTAWRVKTSSKFVSKLVI